MADIAKIELGASHPQQAYAFCATCHYYNHWTPHVWMEEHNKTRHPRRLRRENRDLVEKLKYGHRI